MWKRGMKSEIVVTEAFGFNVLTADRPKAWKSLVL
jgi:hypothetical protein